MTILREHIYPLNFFNQGIPLSESQERRARVRQTRISHSVETHGQRQSESVL